MRGFRYQASRIKYLLNSPTLDSEVVSVNSPYVGTSDVAQLFESHRGRLMFKWAHYLDIYSRLLPPYRNTDRPVRVLEIGVSHGGSLEFFRKVFGANAVIFGVDVDERCAELGGDHAEVRIGSQADPAFLRSVVDEMGGLDVVIDDGSHVAKHQRASFDVLFPLLSDGGLYLIEDTHTAYWLGGYGGGWRRPGTIVQVAKGMADGLTKWHYRAPVGYRATLARDHVFSISFFDSIIAIEKRERTAPSNQRRGTASF